MPASPPPLSSQALRSPAESIASECETGGLFIDAGCWQDQFIPNDEDTAIFDVGGVYTVDFTQPGGGTASVVNDRLLIRSGEITFNLEINNYLLMNPQFAMPSIVVGDDSPVNTILSVIGDGLSGNTVTLGRLPGSMGTLNIESTPHPTGTASLTSPT